MTNVHISPKYAMTAPGIPERNTINKNVFLRLADNPASLAFFTKIACRLKQDRNSFMNTITVDITPVIKEYSERHYLKHRKYLIECNLILKTGSNKSRTYLVNPKAFHCLTRDQVSIDWPVHYSLFPEIIIP